MFRSRLPAVFLVALFATDAKTVDFTVNGMETPYVLLFLFWTLYALFLSPSRRAVHLGIAWAGMMWCRPDSFVYIGALGLGVLLFGRFTPFWGGRRDLLGDFLIAGVILVVLYAPWVFWAWWYYGSPVPQTIIAKGLLMPSVTPSSLLQWLADFPLRIVRDGASLGTTFLPPYGLNSGWPRSLTAASFVLSLVGFLVWLIPRVRWEARVASFAFAVGHFYLNYFARFHSPWYVPTLTVLAFVAIAGLIDPLGGRSQKPDEAAGGARRLSRLILGVTPLLPLGAFLLLLFTGFQMRQAQAINETGNRRVLAEWLKANASTSKDTVFLECLGYIGYFSNLKMYDYPGLCSPEVVAVRRRSTIRGDYIDYFPEIISALGPDWVVLRSSEERRST
jgi:hypothetical protein